VLVDEDCVHDVPGGNASLRGSQRRVVVIALDDDLVAKLVRRLDRLHADSDLHATRLRPATDDPERLYLMGI